MTEWKDESDYRKEGDWSQGIFGGFILRKVSKFFYLARHSGTKQGVTLVKTILAYLQNNSERHLKTLTTV